MPLCGLRRGISGYGWFDIEVDIPSSGSTIKIRRTWDCRKQVLGYPTELMARTISCDDKVNPAGRNIVVTYLVMSDAVEANVEVVKLMAPESVPTTENNRAPDAHVVDGDTQIVKDEDQKQYIFRGEIAAVIETNGLKQRILLLMSSSATSGVPVSAKSKEAMPSFPLERPVVPVPRHKQLHIEIKGRIETKSSSSQMQGDEELSAILSFDFGNPSPRVKNREVEVNVKWPRSCRQDEVNIEQSRNRAPASAPNN